MLKFAEETLPFELKIGKSASERLYTRVYTRIILHYKRLFKNLENLTFEPENVIFYGRQVFYTL